MNTVLETKNLQVYLTERKEEKQLVKNVSFSVGQGECLGILGESGSGKSMTVKAILGLLDRNFRISGQALFEGKDLLMECKESLRRARGNQISMILQNPMTCFDPLFRIENQMRETFEVHTDWDRETIRKNSLKILERMKIQEPEEVLKKYPHQLSGGMLQRIMIGIAMLLQPKLLIADEPTTAIDSVTQYEVLEEFLRIRREVGTAMIFISHDLGAISKVADRILVMNQGKIVDQGNFSHILHDASDEYTRLLVEKRMAVMKKYREMVSGGAICWN
ncbi:MAG: ABC transporter ATP-binding protein [Hungatella sp.]|jgi:nickel transport system ATP-binding protein|nr:ABC transporter ATP-binding protein [Hungatella sp.]MCI9638463.1 ABC transporter ATP-binding protein [Hungatella sp.]